MRKIEDLRKDYIKARLVKEDLHSDPIKQFRSWFNEAQKAEIVEPNSMVLSTVDKKGVPSARIILLKGIEDDGFIFYTNYKSHKADDMETNPHIALVMLWHGMERQVRITGKATKVSRQQSESYFSGRPRGSQIGAWASDQSTLISDRTHLEKQLEYYKQKFENVENIPTPPHWGGYKVWPETIEFWQGRSSRLHDRLRYIKDGEEAWKIIRLSP